MFQKYFHTKLFHYIFYIKLLISTSVPEIWHLSEKRERKAWTYNRGNQRP